MRSGERSLTYVGFADEVDRVASGLLGLGIGRGDRMAVWLVNRPEWLVMQFAASRIGASVVAVNTRLRQDEIGYLLRHSEAKVLVLGEPYRGVDFAGILHEVAPDLEAGRTTHLEALRAVVTVGGARVPGGVAYETLAGATILGDLNAHRPGANDEINLLYTSGTTSKPKGAIRLHRNYLPHVQNIADFLELNHEDVVHWGFPLCGTTGLVLALATFAAGGCGLPATSLDAATVYPELSKAGCTYLPTSDVTVASWLAWEDREQWPVPVRGGLLARFGGVDMRDVLAQVDEAFGCRFVQPYGLTEANALAMCNRPAAPLEERALTGGIPIEPVTVKLVDPETGQVVGDGERGEILLHGPTVFPEYFRNPEATAEMIDGQAWLHTGDLGLQQDGKIFFLSRLKDVLKISGFNVSPAEIEDVVGAHPSVEVVQVVGYEHPQRGEVPVAFVRFASGAECTESDIQDYCATRVAKFKVPWRVLPVTEFPVTHGPQGDKIQRGKLRELAAEALA